MLSIEHTIQEKTHRLTNNYNNKHHKQTRKSALFVKSRNFHKTTKKNQQTISLWSIELLSFVSVDVLYGMRRARGYFEVNSFNTLICVVLCMLLATRLAISIIKTIHELIKISSGNFHGRSQG